MSEDIGVGRHFKYYATIATADKDLHAIYATETGRSAKAARRLYIGGAGNLQLILPSGADTGVFPVAAGEIVDLDVMRIVLAGTTATAIKVYW